MYKSTKISLLILICFYFMISDNEVKGQALLDGFMKNKGQGTVAVSYSYESYDRFNFGNVEMDAPAPVGGDVSTQSVALYANYGLFDNINIVISLPYISVKGTGDESERVQERNNLQDVSIYAKWRPYQVQLGNGILSTITAVGLTTPASNYEPNDILSIGSQATTGNANVLLQYMFKKGLFANAQAGYSLKGNNVPNAFTWSSKVGYAASKFYIDVTLLSQTSESDAPDIGTDVPFYETRVNYTKLGVNGYYAITDKVGVSVGWYKYLASRNSVLSSGFSGGIVYNF